jgi:hypothetical protein
VYLWDNKISDKAILMYDVCLLLYMKTLTSRMKCLSVSLDKPVTGDFMARLKFLYTKRDTKKLLVMALINYHCDYSCYCWFHGLTNFWKDKPQVERSSYLILVIEHIFTN